MGLANLSLRENYWDFPELKREYIGFLIKIFGPKTDLSPWEECGFWDEKYRPFSFFDGQSLVSNVCVYSMEMRILGKKCSVAQISAVGTLPEYRRMGLAYSLLQAAMNWARGRHDFFFLGADQEGFRLYEKCGFRLTDEYKSRLAVQGKAAVPGAVRLDMERRDHVDLIYHLAQHRESVSDIMGVYNARLFMAACLLILKDYIHYISMLHILVLFKRDNGLVTIFDIVGSKMPSFAEIYPYISHPEDRAVEFLFMTDKLNLGNFDLIRIEESGTHLSGDFPLDGTRFIFPFSSHA